MSDVKTLSHRIDMLETRLTFQDVTIETLNETITAQWQQIDVLTRRVGRLQIALCARDDRHATSRRAHPFHATTPNVWLILPSRISDSAVALGKLMPAHRRRLSRFMTAPPFERRGPTPDRRPRRGV